MSRLLACEIAFRSIVSPYVSLMTRKKRKKKKKYANDKIARRSDGGRSLAKEVTWFSPEEQEIIISIYEKIRGKHIKNTSYWTRHREQTITREPCCVFRTNNVQWRLGSSRLRETSGPAASGFRRRCGIKMWNISRDIHLSLCDPCGRFSNIQPTWRKLFARFFLTIERKVWKKRNWNVELHLQQQRGFWGFWLKLIEY